MTGESKKRKIEETPERYRLGPDEHPGPDANQYRQAGQKEDVDDAPTPQAARRVKEIAGQPILPPLPKLQLQPISNANSSAGTPAIATTGRRDESLVNFRASNFLPGYIINAPFHETLMDKNLDMTNAKVKNSIAQSGTATISSKRRFGIVLAAYARNMLVMPTATRGGRDLSHLPNDTIHEYVSIRENGYQGPLDKGVHEYSLIAFMDKGQTLSEFSAVQLSHVAKVDYKADIKIVGALSEDSTHWLIGTWLCQRTDAENNGWREDERIVEMRGLERWDRVYTRLSNRRKRT